MSRFSRKGKLRRARFIRELAQMQLETESRADRKFIGDMLLYAEIGRDRYRLPENYVDEVRGIVQLTEVAE